MDAPGFTIYPAIDLRSGQVVRLLQGDPTRQTTYATDPAVIARRWLAAGARWLHVVDLDAAFGDPASANAQALSAILQAAHTWNPPAQVQFGGGLRSIQAIEEALQAGVSRAILGTLLVDDPGLVQQAVARFGESCLGLALDARAGMVQVRGWQDSSGLPAIELARLAYDLGIRCALYTDIARDGRAVGANIQATARLQQESGLALIASGGAASLEDVRQARAQGLAGIILGRALYDGRIQLEEALQC